MAYGLANPYTEYSLATIYIWQTIYWVQFGYDLRMPNHILGNINNEYGLAATLVWSILFLRPTVRVMFNDTHLPYDCDCYAIMLPLLHDHFLCCPGKKKNNTISHNNLSLVKEIRLWC